MMTAKRHRRALRLVGVATLTAAALAACGSSSTPSSTKPSTKSLIVPKSEHVTLSLWLTSASSDIAGVRAEVAAFNKIYPNIKIKIIETATAGNDPGTIAAAAAHKLPDLMRAADVDTYDFASHNILLNLTPYMKAYGYKESQFVGPIMKLGQYNGQQYVIPRSFDQAVIAYNPQVLRKFGLTVPSEGMTFSTFKHDACAVNKKLNGVQYYGVGTNLGQTSYILYDPFMASTGGGALNSAGTKATFDSPASLRGLTELANFGRSCTAWDDNLPTGADPFTVGRAAFDVVVEPQVHGWENTAHTAWSAVKFPVNVVNFPLLSPHPKDGAGMVGFAATIDTKHPRAAAAFEMFLLSKAGELARSKALGSIPIRKDLATSSVWESAYNFTQATYHYKFNAVAFASYSSDITTPPEKLQLGGNGTPPTAITNAWTAIQDKKQTVKQAFTTATKTINGWLATQ